MNTTIGTSQTSVVLTSNATTSQQNYYFTRFVSDPLSSITSITAQTWTYNYSALTSSVAARFPANNLPVRGTAYVWRPSTQTKVGDIFDGNCTGNCAVASAQRGYNVTFSGSLVSGVQDDDVICWEAIFQVTQSSATAYTDTFYFDGTVVTLTNNSTPTDHASFLETPQTLTFAAAGPTNITRSISDTVTISESLGRAEASQRTISESLTVSESIARSRGQARTASDTTTISESAPTTHREVPKTISDTTTISESVARTQTKTRAVSDTVTIGESVAVQAVLPQPIHALRAISRMRDIIPFIQTVISVNFAETIGVTEVFERLKYSFRTFSEVQTVNDNLDNFVIKSRSLPTESVIITDSFQMQRIKVRTMDESMSVTELLNKQRISIKTIAETLGVSENLVQNRVKVRSISETIGITDDFQRTPIKSRTIDETLSVTDSLSFSRIIARAITETLAMTAVLSYVKTNGRLFAENLSITDSVAAIKTKTRTFAETFNSIQDSITRQTIRPRSFAQSVSISETLSSMKTRGKAFAESISVTDSLTKVAAKTRTFADTIGITDSLTKTKSRLRNFAETLSVTESFTRAAAKTRTFAETIGVTEVLTRAKTSTRAIATETMTVADSLTRATSKVRTFAESLTTTDLLSRSLLKARSITESITIGEILTFPRIITRIFTESISITALFTAVKTPRTTINEFITVLDSFTRQAFKARTISETVSLQDRLEITPLKGWILSGHITDFPDKLDNLIKEYITAKWSAEPRIDIYLSSKITLDNFDYDKFRTYYIKITEGKSKVKNHETRQKLYDFETPVTLECTVRSLSKGEVFPFLNNMINELLRIFGEFQKEEIFGIQGISLDSITPLGNDAANKSVWQRVLGITLYYYKFDNS